MRRRTLLTGLGTGLLGGLAGCGSSGSTSTTTSTTTAEYRGPGSEDAELVDLRYRDFDDAATTKIREAATTPDYEAFFRDIDNRVGDAVVFDAGVSQVLETDVDGLYYLLCAIDGSGQRLVWGSWLGERVLRGDTIRLWGRVLGTETYQSSMTGQRTLPAIAIAALELAETTSSNTAAY